MIKVIKPKKPVQKYSATCHRCEAEFTFDKTDTRTIYDGGQCRGFDVVTCPECGRDISTTFWNELK